MQCCLTTKENDYICLNKVKIYADIDENICHTRMVQYYENSQSKNPVEIFYTFPMYGGSAVYRMTADVDGKIIESVLKEQSEARAEYNIEKSKGHGVFLMERMMGDIYSMSLGNVNPGSKIVITLYSVVELDTEADVKCLRAMIPLTIFPRYVATDYGMGMFQRSVSNIKLTYEKPYKVSISGHITQINGIVSVDSKTCKIMMSNFGPNNVDFKIKDLDKINSDIILCINIKQPNTSCITQESQHKLHNEKFRWASMVNIVPNFSDVPETLPKDIHITLIMDKSGSMCGNRIESCKEAALIFLNCLPIGSNFDIYTFSNTFDKFQSTEKDFAKRKDEAIKFVKKITADGGTEMYTALDDAYKNSNGKKSVFILLTDGDIGNEDSVFNLVQKNPHVTVFTIGIGDGVSTSLVKTVAKYGNGCAEFVKDDKDDLKKKIMAQYYKAKRVFRGIEEELKVEFDESSATFMSLFNKNDMYVTIPSNVVTYGNCTNTFYILSKYPIKQISHVVSYKIPQQNSMATCDNAIPVRSLSDNCNQMVIHKLAGMLFVDELSHRGYKTQTLGSKILHLMTTDTNPYKKEIVDASLDLGVLSKFTSFIGVEVRQNPIPEENELVVVPLQQPQIYAQSASYSYPKSLNCRGATSTTSAMPACASATFAMPACASDSYDSYMEECAEYDCDMGIVCLESSGSNAFCDDISFNFDNQKTKYDTKLKIEDLPPCDISGDLYTGKTTGKFMLNGVLFNNLNVGEYIEVTQGKYKGIYLVWNMGSTYEQWVFEKVL